MSLQGMAESLIVHHLIGIPQISVSKNGDRAGFVIPLIPAKIKDITIVSLHIF